MTLMILHEGNKATFNCQKPSTPGHLCQGALSYAFADLADRAAAAGWSDEEVAVALAALADNRMLSLVEIARLEVLLDDLKERLT